MVVQVGTAAYVVDVVSVAENSITYQFHDIGSTASFTKVSPFTPQPCGLLDTADGLAISWGIATAWLVTYGVLILKRGLHE